MRLPIKLTEEIKEKEYNLFTKLKDKGLMDEKNRLIVPVSIFISEDRQRGRIVETSSIREEYADLSELEIAILKQYFFLDGEFRKVGNDLILDYYI